MTETGRYRTGDVVEHRSGWRKPVKHVKPGYLCFSDDDHWDRGDWWDESAFLDPTDVARSQSTSKGQSGATSPQS